VDPVVDPVPNSFPVDLTGPAPEESSIIITVNKPADASKGLITLFVLDADFADEGELVINGNPAIPLFGTAGITDNDAKSTEITISTPASYWQDADNTLLFRHTSTAGYIINNVTVQFEGSTEPVVTGSVNLSWTAPSQREDGKALSLGEIKGFRIYYGVSPGEYPIQIDIDGGNTNENTLNMATGTYYFVLTTIDMDGRESGYSEMVTKSI
jgi:hypothetical protein